MRLGIDGHGYKACWWALVVELAAADVAVAVEDDAVLLVVEVVLLVA